MGRLVWKASRIRRDRVQGPRRLNSLTPGQTVGALQSGGGGGWAEGAAEVCNRRREKSGRSQRTHIRANKYNEPLTPTLRALRETQAAPLNPSYKKFTKLVRSDPGFALQANRPATDCAALFSEHMQEISRKMCTQTLK